MTELHHLPPSDSPRRNDVLWATWLLLILIAVPLAMVVITRGDKTIVDRPAITPSDIHIININQADLAELSLLPNIGPTRAERIIAYRRTHGPYGSVDDLIKIDGIGQITLNGIRPYIVCEPVDWDDDE